MSKTITVEDVTFGRLEKHAKGFDTPANVIMRLLDYYETNEGIEYDNAELSIPETPTNLEVIFHPEDERVFKTKLIENKKAWILLYKTGGSISLHEWNAKMFTEMSNLRGNLQSGYLRNWKSRKIFKAEIAIEKDDLIGKPTPS